MKLFLAALPLLAASSMGDTATQTSWHTGHVLGPLSVWGNNYYSATSLCPWQGTIQLGYGEMFLIEGSLDGPRAVASCDIDDDGDADIAAAWAEGCTIAWLENKGGSPPSWTRHTLSGSYKGARSVCCGDIDGDGLQDIVGVAYDGNRIDWWENPGPGPGVWTLHNIAAGAGANGPWFICLADIDDDGSLDVVSCLYGSSEIVWWDNSTAPGTFWRRRVVCAGIENPRACCAADFDADGDIDIAGAFFWSDKVWWWENCGGGLTWIPHSLAPLAGPHYLDSGDIDGDGDVDIAAAGWVDDHLVWYENRLNAEGDWLQGMIADNLDAARSVRLEDVDSDGDLDAVASSSGFGSGLLAWYENTEGSGDSWLGHISVFGLSGAYDATAADIDGSSALEIIGCALNADSIVWCSPFYEPNGILESSILYLGNDPGWGSVSWNASIPSGATMLLQARATDNWSTQGPWSMPMQPPCSLDGILEEGDSFLQYRLILETTNPLVSPILYDITFSWDPVGISDEFSAINSGEFEMSMESNPVVGPDPAAILAYIPEVSTVLTSVFDISGRLVWESEVINHPAGLCCIQIGSLQPGAYFVRMNAGESEATQRFVVLD